MANFQDISLSDALWLGSSTQTLHLGGGAWSVSSEAPAWAQYSGRGAIFRYTGGYPSTGVRPDFVCVKVAFVNPANWAAKHNGGGAIEVEFGQQLGEPLWVPGYNDWMQAFGVKGSASIALTPGFDFTQTLSLEIPLYWCQPCSPFGGDAHPTPEGQRTNDWHRISVSGRAFPDGELTHGVAGEFLTVFDMVAGECGAAPPVQYDCGQKPYTHTMVLGSPGFPGIPAVPYKPETCYFPPCYTRTTTTTPALLSGGSSGSAESSFNPSWSINTLAGCIGSGCLDPSVPLYSANQRPPALTPQFVVGGFLTDDKPRTTTETVCPPQVCTPEQPYIPAIPAQEPTPDQVVSNYNLGWSFDVEGCDFNGMSVTIGAEMVNNSTAGVAVGVCAKADAGHPGIIKYRAMWLFTGGQVEGFIDGVSVSTEEAREGHTFGIRHAGEELALLRDDVVVSTVNPFAGESYLAATIYKGGDAACFSCDSLTEATTYVYTSEPNDMRLPMPQVRAGAAMDGADFFIPAARLTSSGELGSGVAAGALRLPGFRLFAAADEFAGVTGRLPAMVVDGAGGIPIPTAEGADLFLSGLRMYGESGFRLTGGAKLDLPAPRFFAADRPMGFAQSLRYPAPSVYGADFWRFAGVLFGEMEGLEVGDLWGWVTKPNNLSGSLPALDGTLYGGAQLRGEFLIAGEFAGSVANVGRIDGSFANLVMNSTGLVGAHGELAGILAAQIDGELWGGATLFGNLVALAGDFDGTTGIVGALLGELSPLAGDLFGSLQNYGILLGEFGPMEPLWGLLDGELVALDGRFVEGVTLGEYRAWVMNLTHAGVTTYPQYGFDFIVRWQGKHYMGNIEGIFELGGDRDENLPIQAGFTLPSSDYGTSRVKRAPRVYYQGRADRRMMGQVRADDGERYETESEGYGGEDYWRIRVGRGLHGHHLEFGLDNQGGGDFEIEAVDVLIADSGRKI